jgi:hypothetical protein
MGFAFVIVFVCWQAKYYGMSFTFLPDEASGTDDVFADLRAIGAVAASEDGACYRAYVSYRSYGWQITVWLTLAQCV